MFIVSVARMPQWSIRHYRGKMFSGSRTYKTPIRCPLRHFCRIEPPEVSTFCLSRIVAPNGRELIVKYADRVPSEYHDDPRALILSPFLYEELLKYRINECYQLSASPTARAPKREADRSYTRFLIMTSTAAASRLIPPIC